MSARVLVIKIYLKYMEQCICIMVTAMSTSRRHKANIFLISHITSKCWNNQNFADKTEVTRHKHDVKIKTEIMTSSLEQNPRYNSKNCYYKFTDLAKQIFDLWPEKHTVFGYTTKINIYRAVRFSHYVIH